VLQGLELISCVNATTCLNPKPKVVTGVNGASANIFLDNLAYREFLYSHFNVSLVDMETAAAALVPSIFYSLWCLLCIFRPALSLDSVLFISWHYWQSSLVHLLGCFNYSWVVFSPQGFSSCVQVCYEADIPFIAFRSLSDLAGGGTGPNQIAIFGDLAADNAALFVTSFFKLLEWITSESSI